jgi:hypothetical protein
MKDGNKIWHRLDLAKRVVIFSGSLALSLWLIIILGGVGMFGFQNDQTWQSLWIKTMLWAFGGGCISGFLWGGSDLRNIFWVAVPGAMWLGFTLISLPFVLLDPGAAGIAQALLEYMSILMLFVCIACFPLLGPLISHAVWNNKSWSEMREEIEKQWKEFKKTNKIGLGKTDGSKGIFSIPWFDSLPRTVRALIVSVLLGLIFSLFKF